MSIDQRRQRQEYVCKARAEIKKYEFALKTIVTLEHIFSTLKNTTTYQGKTLHVPDSGPRRADRAVTPDVVVEAGWQKSPYRAVVEIKESLSALPENWSEIIDQLVKYTLATDGWGNTPDVLHDVMLAAGAPNVTKFSNWVGDNTEMPDIKKWLIIIEINPAIHDSVEYVEISRIRGKILYPAVSNALPTQTRRVPLYNILKKIDQLKFYDSHPPVAYTMAILWDHVFSKFIHGKKLDEFNDDKKVMLTISMKQIRKTIMGFSPRTNPACVRQRWIRAAMLKFEAIHVVSRKGDESFTVTYKRHARPTLDWILDHMATLQSGGIAPPPGVQPAGITIDDFF